MHQEHYINFIPKSKGSRNNAINVSTGAATYSLSYFMYLVMNHDVTEMVRSVASPLTCDIDDVYFIELAQEEDDSVLQ